jgi:hypothetical protein
LRNVKTKEGLSYLAMSQEKEEDIGEAWTSDIGLWDNIKEGVVD